MAEIPRQSIKRLLEVAQGNSAQSCICANFLLAWWNASSCGGFDLTELSQLDTQQLREDCLTVLEFIALDGRDRFDLLAYTAQFQRVIDAWRPALA